MKKILFYINAIHHGGAERVMCNLATQFSEAGYECVLVTSFRDTWEYSFGEKVRRISLFEEPLSTGFLKRNFALVRALRKTLKAEKPDLLVSFMAEPNYRAIMASIGLRNKVLISVRNDPCREYPGRFTRFLAKTLFRLADGVVFQTEDAKKWFPRAIQKKSRIIFNQVAESFYGTAYTGERRDVVTTGRLTAQKNHAMLIRAFSGVKNSGSDRLVIWGDGELHEELSALIAELGMEEKILLPGSTKSVKDSIRSAKLFVLSSDYEGMPNSLMEAMALGLPCLSTDCPCGGPRVLFGEGGGVLVPVGDEVAMTEALERLLSDAERRNTLGQSAAEAALAFTPDRVFGEWREEVDTLTRQ